MVLQRLIQEGHLEVEESLVDMNNTVLKVMHYALDMFLSKLNYELVYCLEYSFA